MLSGADNIGASTPGTGEARPTRPTREGARCRGLRAGCLAGAILAPACDERVSGRSDSATWLTEAEYKLSGDPDQDVLFSRIRVLQADPYRDRVFVLDLQDTELSVWTPAGSLEFVLGRKGEGPGEFMMPTRVEFIDSGNFYVREGWGSRFTYYAADGTLSRTDAGGPTSLMYRGHGLTFEAPTGDGGYFAVPLSGSSIRMEGGIDRYPLLYVTRSVGEEWHAPEPLFWLDRRNRQHPIDLGEDRIMWVNQRYGDSDLMSFAPGAAVVGRRAGGEAGVELIELNASGDTVWSRRLRFKPQRLTPKMIRERGDFVVANLTIPGVSPGRLRQAWEEGLHKPEYLPAAKGMMLTASGEVWLSTFENPGRSDTLVVCYAVRRGDVTGQPRRVLLPKSISLVNGHRKRHTFGH
ncbi:MAG: hypothetical protein OXQ94_16365 [Gemmatimonadota bacterium]|nr:hypothetical protein [Gemmatimonadota bacterium]MDE2873253.1 hypothetical protein [Gemmatimonadota bacterium]